MPRLVLNLLVVWLLTGLWHGADENFVLWGFYYFVLLVFEKLFLKRWLDRAPSIISRAYTLLLVAIGWLIFSFKSEYGGVRGAISYLLGMLGMGGVPLYNGEFIYIFVGNLSLMILLILASTPIPKHIFRRICEKVDCFNILGDAVSLISAAVLVALFLLCIVYISSSEYRPNIYFEF